MNLALYSAASVFAAVGMVAHAFYTREQFFPAMLYLSSSKIALVIMCNLGFVMLLLFGHLLKLIFFGRRLREAEVERLHEQSRNEVMEMCLAMTIFRQEFNLQFVGMFSALMFLKVFHWLTQKRVEYIETTPAVSRFSHVRIVTFMLLLLAVDCFLEFHAVSSLYRNWQPSVLILFSFEYFLLASAMIANIVKYTFYMVDTAMDGQWENKALCVYYLDLVRDLLHLIVYIVFFGVIFTSLHVIPLHLFRDLYETFRSFQTRVADFIRYRQITSNLNERFPDATPEEIARSDNTCIICREEMTQAKKLPCSHLFHVHCLRTWLERQQTCPTCRAPLLAPQQQAAPRAGAAQGGVQGGLAAAAAPGAAAPGAGQGWQWQWQWPPQGEQGGAQPFVNIQMAGRNVPARGQQQAQPHGVHLHPHRHHHHHHHGHHHAHAHGHAHAHALAQAHQQLHVRPQQPVQQVQAQMLTQAQAQALIQAQAAAQAQVQAQLVQAQLMQAQLVQAQQQAYLAQVAAAAAAAGGGGGAGAGGLGMAAQAQAPGAGVGPAQAGDAASAASQAASALQNLQLQQALSPYYGVSGAGLGYQVGSPYSPYMYPPQVASLMQYQQAMQMNQWLQQVQQLQSLAGQRQPQQAQTGDQAPSMTTNGQPAQESSTAPLPGGASGSTGEGAASSEDKKGKREIQGVAPAQENNSTAADGEGDSSAEGLRRRAAAAALNRVKQQAEQGP